MNGGERKEGSTNAFVTSFALQFLLRCLCYVFGEAATLSFLATPGASLGRSSSARNSTNGFLTFVEGVAPRYTGGGGFA